VLGKIGSKSKGLSMNKVLISVFILALFPLEQVGASTFDVTAVLLPPKSNAFYRPMETFYISVPSGLDAEGLAQLSLEFDGIDVTALAKRDAAGMSYTPVKRLDHGARELRLMHYASDGSVAELGFWQVEVRQSKRFRDARFDGLLTLSSAQSLAERNLDSGLDSATQGGGQLGVRLAQDTWHMEGSADFAFADRQQQSLTGRRADIPNFLVAAEVGVMSLKLGDQIVHQASLLSDGYQRRGVSSTAALSALDSQLTVYGVSASQVVGIREGLGVSDSDNRITGVDWYYQPVQSDTNTVLLTTSFLSGRLSQNNVATEVFDVFATNTVEDGKAANVTLDTQFFQRQLRVRLESANSRYDFDGENFGFDAESDRAWSALVLVDPHLSDHEVPIDWSVSLEKQKIGAFFKSLSNVQLPSDKRLERAIAKLARGSWLWEGVFAEERNNLDNNVDYATTVTKQWVLTGGYTDYTPATEGVVAKFFGQPSYRWSATRVRMEDEMTPLAYFANDLTTRAFSLAADFAHDTWRWSLAVSHDSLQDHSDWQPDTRTRAVQLGGNMQFGSRYQVGVSAQMQKTLYRVQAVHTDRQLYTLDAQGELLRDRLFANVSVGLTVNDAERDPFFAVKDQSIYASSNINWRIRKAKRHRLGFDLALSLIYNNHKDRLSIVNDIEGYQAFLKFTTVLPTVFPGGL